MINQLRTLARAVTEIVLDIYDREESESILPLIAQPVNRPSASGSNLVEVEWWSAFPQLRKWVGDRKTQKVFQEALEVRIEPYEITLDIDRNRLGERGEMIDDPTELAGPIVRGFSQGKVQLAATVLGENRISYDGQDFFDAAHTHPNGAVFSNLLTRGTDSTARTTDATPTAAEVRHELRVARARLLQNTIIRNVLVRSAEIDQSIVVIARDDETWNAFEDLRTEERIGTDINRFRNTFQLIREFGSAAPALSYDVIHSVPGGPRPVVFVAAKEPGGLEFDATQEFRSRYIAFGSDGKYGAAPGFPQVAARSIAP
jgi:hypothetical protein